jgi:hydrogenase maturation factor
LRWYVVAPVEIGGIYDQFVVTTLNEGAIDEGGHVCIHIGYRFQDMPLGDQLASLVMTLHNDKALFDEIDVHIDSYY